MRVDLKTDGWKTSLDDYVKASQNLLASMQSEGFRMDRPIPLDPDGELLDGSHRLSCAIALGLEDVAVTYSDKKAWAPAWGKEWFLEVGAPSQLIERVETDFQEMLDRAH